MNLSPLQIFLSILRWAPGIMMIIIALTFVFSVRTTVITDEAQRTNLELAENILSSGLTYDRAVFDPAKLDALTEVETVARNCKYEYTLEIKDLATGKKWSFGYSPKQTKIKGGTIPSSADYHVSLLKKTAADPKGYESVVPATMTITAQESWLTRLDCLVEEAIETKETRNMQMPCIFENLGTEAADKGSAVSCNFRLKKNQRGQICIDSSLAPGDTAEQECRYFPDNADIPPNFISYPKDGIENKKLIAYPLKETPALSATPCDKNELNSLIADKTDPNARVKAVILCVE